MCDGQVGNDIALWLMEHYRDDIGAVVTVGENPVYIASRALDIPTFVYESEPLLLTELSRLPRCDLGMLVWWPKLISPKLMGLTSQGFINTHPSLLPYNRGKHYNFWALVGQCPFGVSLHYVDEGIDSGDIVAQTPISYGWEDTGETLHLKASQGIIQLFKATYPNIRSLELNRTKQDLSKGSVHYAKEIDAASQIVLDKSYNARELINLLRARTFPGHPACWFDDNGANYEITVNIKRKDV